MGLPTNDVSLMWNPRQWWFWIAQSNRGGPFGNKAGTESGMALGGNAPKPSGSLPNRLGRLDPVVMQDTAKADELNGVAKYTRNEVREVNDAR